MATRERLEQALRNAHEAGDKKAAKRFADAIRAGEFDEPEQGERSLYQKANDALRPAFETGPGKIAAEFMSAVNRGAIDLAEFFTTDQVNAVMELAGSDKRVPGVGDSDFVKGATTGGYMDEGMGRDVVAGAGEIIPSALGAGAMARGAASRLPAATAGESTATGVVRQMGGSTATADAGLAALSGSGAEVGGAIGGDVGRAAGGMLAPMAGGLRPMASGVTRPPASPSAGSTGAAERTTGIDLFPAQRSLDAGKLRAQRFLPELTPTTQRAAEALSKQSKQAAKAVDDFIGMIGPDDSVVTASEKFRGASQRALESAKLIRSEKASPFYRQAFEEGADVDLTPVRNTIRVVRADFPETGGVASSINKVDKMLSGTPSLKRLHNTKLEIDDMLNKVGEGSAGNTAKRELRNIKQALVDQMEAASPVYRDARLAFEAASPPVNKLQDSIIGKIANMDDTQLKSVSRRIFDPSETNPEVVRNAKKVIDEVDPDAWNRLLRAEVERRVGSIKPEIGTSFENVPSKNANAIFGTGKNRDALLAGMTPKQRKHAEFLETALVRAGLGRPGGSETAGRQQFIKDVDSGLISATRNFLKSPVDRTLSVGEGKMFDKRAKALADALFDPAWVPAAEKAMKDKSGKSFGYLLYQVNDQIDRATKKEDRQEQGSPQR